jgi:hypothetical protein
MTASPLPSLPIKPAPTVREPELVSKVCSVCGESKPRSGYYKNSSLGDGLFAECKVCWCARTRAYRAANDDVRERDRVRRKQPERSAKLAAAAKQFRRDNPEKTRAYNAVRYALSTGKLVRQPCEVCGDPKSQAHHDDYAKRLDVRWLCARHHAKHHAAMKWTILNDEWVRVQFLLARSASGLSDRPAARSASDGS